MYYDLVGVELLIFDVHMSIHASTCVLHAFVYMLYTSRKPHAEGICVQLHCMSYPVQDVCALHM